MSIRLPTDRQARCGMNRLFALNSVTVEMIDLAVIIGYFSIMLVVGWQGRRQSAGSYWAAERRQGTGWVGVSMVATIFGASSTMGMIGLGYSRGLTGAWWSLTGGIALIPFGIFLASRVRALGVHTLPDILERAYGKGVAMPAGIIIVLAWSGVIAAQLVAGARLLSGLAPLDFQVALGTVAIVIITYTFWGGQVSVIRTDLWQFLLFLGGLFVSLAFLASSWDALDLLLDELPPGRLDFPVSPAFGWYDLLVYYPLVVGLAYLAGPDIYSRVLCARDDRVASRSTLLAAALVIPLSFLLALFGLLARAHFPGIPPEAALSETIGVLMPAGVRGLIVAGFLAAVMSSADTCLISAATIVSLNVVAPISGNSIKGQLAVTRAAVLVIGGLAWIVAGLEHGIISSLLLAYSIFVSGVAVPTLASFYKERLGITSIGAMSAVVVGGASAVVGKINGGAFARRLLTGSGDALFRQALGPEYLSILPIILSLVVMAAASRVTR